MILWKWGGLRSEFGNILGNQESRLVTKVLRRDFPLPYTARTGFSVSGKNHWPLPKLGRRLRSSRAGVQGHEEGSCSYSDVCSGEPNLSVSHCLAWEMPAYRGGQKAWEEAAGGETCGVLCGNVLEWLG